MVGRPLVVITGRHRPHEILLLVASLITGVAYTVGAPPPASVTALLPGWAIRTWAVGMALSGALGLVGALARGGRALQVEQASMMIGAGALIWYTAAVAPFGWRALFAGLISVLWAAANLWRAWQIRSDLRAAR